LKRGQKRLFGTLEYFRAKFEKNLPGVFSKLKIITKLKLWILANENQGRDRILRFEIKLWIWWENNFLNPGRRQIVWTSSLFLICVLNGQCLHNLHSKSKYVKRVATSTGLTYDLKTIFHNWSFFLNLKNFHEYKENSCLGG
jgi:hypothetical protein